MTVYRGDDPIGVTEAELARFFDELRAPDRPVMLMLAEYGRDGSEGRVWTLASLPGDRQEADSTAVRFLVRLAAAPKYKMPPDFPRMPTVGPGAVLCAVFGGPADQYHAVVTRGPWAPPIDHVIMDSMKALTDHWHATAHAVRVTPKG